MRAYITLLRLPYQLQLGPIFAWGYVLGGGRLARIDEAWRFLAVFALFHVGAFGGLTALNSHYDRDDGPVGGLWQPPSVPSRLFLFAWMVQLGGLILLLPFGWKLCGVYALILALSLGYSHPRTRWKGHPFKSLLVVALGQGVLDFLAGALTTALATNAAARGSELQPIAMTSAALWWGMAGATCIVVGFYPLTQLYQMEADARRGEVTTALWLLRRWSRRGVFAFAAMALGGGAGCSLVALLVAGHTDDARWLLPVFLLPAAVLVWWSSDRAPSPQRDFARVHFLLRSGALAFTAYLVWAAASW